MPDQHTTNAKLQVCVTEREGGRQADSQTVNVGAGGRLYPTHTQAVKDVVAVGFGGGGGGFHIIHYRCPLQSEGGPTAMATEARFSSVGMSVSVLASLL